MSFFPKQPSSRLGTTQAIRFDANTPVKNHFGPETWQIRLVADTSCHFRIGEGEQKATTDDAYLPADSVEYVIVSPGNRISAVKAKEAGGTLWITETN